MPLMLFILALNSFWLEMYLVLTAVIFKSGSIAWYKSATTDVKPFMADKIITNAAVVMAMATMLIHDITLMALLDFFEIKYRLAMKNERFKNY